MPKTCTCPDIWCQIHATCGACGSRVIIEDPDGLAFCPECECDVMPRGGCKVIDAPDCADDNCKYLEPHHHGFACDKTCTCEARP